MSTLPTTVHLPFLSQGDPAGVPVVFLHGLSDSWRSFEPLLPYIPSLRAIAVTQRGHGDAPKPYDGYDIDGLAADVAGVLDDAGVERAVVVGHSMGSIVATRVGLAYPERVSGLVLLGAKPTYDVPELQEFFAFLETFEDPVDPEFIREFQESTVVRPVPASIIDTAVSESRKLPARVWRALAATGLRADHTEMLGRIEAPTLLMYGDRDEYVSREDQDALLAGLPDARLRVYEGTGHAMHWEDPAACAHDLVAFVEERVVV
jgi:pimeloyl-ACP methyl ester carboxylesterase